MAFMKFSKGKRVNVLPNGIGDGSAYFDGMITEINCSNIVPYGNSPRTIAFWVQAKNWGSGGGWFFWHGESNGSDVSYIAFQCKSKQIVMDYCYAGYHSVHLDFEVTQRFHVALTINDSGNYIIYVNGINKANGTLVFNTTKGNMFVGCVDPKYSDSSTKFQGYITNFNVYNRALSADEVTTLYNKGIVTDGLVLNVPLTYGKDDESIFSSKSFVYDYSILTTSSGFDEWGYPIRYDIASECGISYCSYPVPANALLSNCDSLTSDTFAFTNCEVSTDVKMFGKGSIKINEGGYIKFDHDINLLNTAWTVGHFFYLDNYASGDNVKPMINNDDDKNGTFLVGIRKAGYLTFQYRGGSVVELSSYPLESGWHHVRVTHISGNILRLYLDGVFIHEQSGFSRLNNTMWIGRLGGANSYQFSGYIDNIEFFEIPSDKLANYSGETAPVPNNKF